MDDNFKSLLSNVPILNPDILKNIQVQKVNIPIQQPNIVKINNEANNDCPYTNLCEKLDITERNICYSGANINHRCSFGESRNIILLSQLLTNAHHDKDK